MKWGSIDCHQWLNHLLGKYRFLHIFFLTWTYKQKIASHIILLWFQIGELFLLLSGFAERFFFHNWVSFCEEDSWIFPQLSFIILRDYSGMASKSKKGKKKKSHPYNVNSNPIFNPHLFTFTKVNKKFEELCVQFSWYFSMKAYA